MKGLVITAALWLGALSSVVAQDVPAVGDTAKAAPPSALTPPDDSLRGVTSDAGGGTADTTLSFETASSADTIVAYTARDSIVYRLKDKTMRLFGAAAIDYGSTGIKAERITLNWDSSTIAARGIPDTAKGREGRMAGTPVLREGDEVYNGLEMMFHFKTKRGVITEAETEIDNGWYLGKRIKRMSEEAYFISDGKYTTCDLPGGEKHYYFGSPKMKVVPDDVIVAEPIVLYIADIPVFALPFAVIPSKSGRSSGIIVPSFGDDYARGRYLRSGGYYLAMSDYWDAKLTADVYSKGGYQLSLGTNYALRYNFTGSVNASWGRQTFRIGSPYEPDDQPRTDYNVAIQHNQEIDPTSRLSVNFSFLSNSYYQSFSNNLNELLNQSVRSSANYSTSWEGSNRSMSVNISREQNLQDGTSSNVLPEISFNQSQIFPFRRSNAGGEEAWYEAIGFNYGGRALHTLATRKRFVYNETDTSEISEHHSRRGLQHSIGLITSPKLGYITLQPSFSFQSRWYDQRIERYLDAADTTVRARLVNGFYILNTFNFRVSAGTKLYGTITPNIAGILGIRHTLQPSISYAYNPDFSSPFWGYYQSYEDRTGASIRYDPYTGYAELPGTAFGGAGAGESQTIGMDIANVFEMKISPAEDDTTMTPRKFQLLNLNLSSSYNVVRDSLKLAPISMNFRTNVQNLLDVYGSATFSPYVYQRERADWEEGRGRILLEPGHEVDRLLISEGRGIARLTTFDLHLNANLSNELFASKRTAADTADGKGAPGSRRVPWSMNVGYDYSFNTYNPDAKTRSSSMRASLTISPTERWRISASTYYDFVSKQIGTPQIGVQRDLHCWEMTFSWVPTGYYRHFELVIRLKAPQLQDIKLERKGSDRGVY